MIISVIAIVTLVGLFAIHPQEELVTGEADASEYRVSNMVPGHVDTIYVKEGDFVKKGDTLAHINSKQVAAKMQQATAVQNAASAQSRKAKGGARSQQIEMAYQVWQKAIAAEEVYRKSYERVKDLKEKGVVAQQKLDEVEQQYLMAKEGAQQEDIAAAAALVNQAGGAVAEVQSYLDDSYIIAPSDGQVVETYVKVGDLIGTGSPVMSILDMSDCWFFFAVREDMLKGINAGDTVKIKIPALSDTMLYEGEVRRVQAMASYATWRATKTNGQYDVKSFDVKVVPTGKIEDLKPGMTAILQN